MMKSSAPKTTNNTRSVVRQAPQLATAKRAGRSQARKPQLPAAAKAQAPVQVKAVAKEEPAPVAKQPEVEEIKEPEAPKTAAQLAMDRMERLLATSAQTAASTAAMQDKLANVQQAQEQVLGKVAKAEQINANIERIWMEKFGTPAPTQKAAA